MTNWEIYFAKRPVFSVHKLSTLNSWPHLDDIFPHAVNRRSIYLSKFSVFLFLCRINMGVNIINNRHQFDTNIPNNKSFESNKYIFHFRNFIFLDLSESDRMSCRWNSIKVFFFFISSAIIKSITIYRMLRLWLSRIFFLVAFTFYVYKKRLMNLVSTRE